MGRIFLEFLNRSIAAGWLILAVIVLRLLLKKAPKWTSCLLWAVVAVRLACPFSPESVFSLIPSRETVRMDASVFAGPSVDSGIAFVDDRVNPVLENAFAAGPQAAGGETADREPGRDRAWVSLPDVAGAVWAAGAAVMLLYGAAAYIRLRMRLRTAVRLQEETNPQGIVYVSEFADTPFIFGVLRPRIYLPASMPCGMREPVLAHEAAHLKRRDNLWKLLSFILLCLYWFQLLCWAAYILFGRDMELACDEKVIRDYTPRQKRLYSEALLACSAPGRSALVGQHVFGDCHHVFGDWPLAFGEVGVKARIGSVLRYKKPGFWAVLAAVAVCAAAAVCFLTDPAGSGDDPAGALSEEEGGASAGVGVLSGEEGGDSARVGVLSGEEGGASARVGVLSGEEGGASVETGALSEEDGGSSGALSGEDGGSSGTMSGEGGGASGEADPLSGENGASGETPEGMNEQESEELAALRSQLAREWARAFVSRDGEAIASMLTEELVADFVSGPVGERSFGVSSPWPRDEEKDGVVIYTGVDSAEIRYYAWTSDPTITVWYEEIFYELRDGKYVVIGENLTYLDDISTSEEFGKAYGTIDGLPMDYEVNGEGENLNSRAMLSSSFAYRGLFEPESAAVQLLNLSGEPGAVQMERLYEDESGVNLEIVFSGDEDGMPMYVTMIRPYGDSGIWIPKDRRVDVIARLKKVDWEEIRSRNLPVTTYLGRWHDVVCIAEVPEKDIKLYGYNDREWYFQGVAVDMGGEMSFFDWDYADLHTVLPKCYWKEAAGQLQVSLHIYTGPRSSADALHILQRLPAGGWSDSALEIDRLWELLEERISYEFEEDTGRLTLLDEREQKEIVSVEIEGEKVKNIELGRISEFVPGEKILFRLEPGYYPEDGWIAEYPDDMPTLEMEVLMEENGEGVTFDLGEIHTVQAAVD